MAVGPEIGNKWMKNSFIYLLIIVAVIAIFFALFPRTGGTKEISLSTVIEMSQEGRVDSIELNGDSIAVTTRDNQNFKSRKESDTSFMQLLNDAGVNTGVGGVEINVKGSGGMGSIFGLLLNFLPLILFGGILLFMMRQAQGSNNQAMGFGKSRAKLFVGNRQTVTFADVAGVDEAKAELEEIVEFLKYPEQFSALGARTPRGVLLIGPPGTGKTLLGRAVAGEAAVPFFSISGSEFVEMFVGVGASRVRDLFDQAKRNAPCIVFVDEIDAVGRHRGAGLGGGHDEREQTLNQILVEMDGFDSSTNVIVMAATNRPDILDPALLRPGRFDRRVILDQPDIRGRKAILEVHSKGKPLAADVSLEVVARQTPGFSGADLANLVNEAAIQAARHRKKIIEMPELAEAIDRLIAGPERKSRLISQKEKAITAYHEAGHALVAWSLPNADPVQKVSIVARGRMGGYTRILPTEDHFLYSKEQFKGMLATALGGRVAEEAIFNEVTTGASNDLETATKISRRMVTEFGMSESLGPRTFGHKEELVFLGREITEQRDYSERIAEEIDQEVHGLIHEAHLAAHEIVRSKRAKLVQIARHLIRHETVEGEELEKLFQSEAPPLDEGSELDWASNGAREVPQPGPSEDVPENTSPTAASSS
jgi:cell division protease FtsH